MEDPDIIAAVLGGRIEAYTELVSRYHRPLYYFLVGKNSEEAEVEDLIQKSFVTAYFKLAEFDVTQPFIRWLRGIALNHCRNEWKRVERQARMQKRLLTARLAELSMEHLDQVDKSSENRISALRMCMERLSDSEKTLVQRRFIEDLPLQEIGDLFGKGAEAIRLTLFRLRQRLRSCVEKRLTVDGGNRA
jgi:RNA polymerase sigma-70 factor (ECF subfamily)